MNTETERKAGRYTCFQEVYTTLRREVCKLERYVEVTSNNTEFENPRLEVGTLTLSDPSLHRASLRFG